MQLSTAISGMELRRASLWKGMEPEPLPDFVLEDLKKLVPQWEMRDYFTEHLHQEVLVQPPKLINDDILASFQDIVGKENVKADALTRIKYSHGFSTEDLIRIRKGEFATLAEMVVHPRTEDEIRKILALCEQLEIPLIPVGGGTSVTRAVHFTKPGIALALRPHLTKIIKISPSSMTVTVEAGILGPELEHVLNREGFTIGHFPQSFEQSTVGGWIAARGAGQNSTLRGKIEDLVVNLRIVTPIGLIEPPLSPASALGPQNIPVFIGSEGTLGIITRATLKIFHDPTPQRKFASYLFPDFHQGIEALEELSQRDFLPSIVRLSDGLETLMYSIIGRKNPERGIMIRLLEKYLDWRGYSSGVRSLLILVYEGTVDYVKNAEKTVSRIIKNHDGLKAGAKFAQTWFAHRFEHPHLRDYLLDLGILIDTIETATTWEKLPRLYDSAISALSKEVDLVFAHISHLYPEGASLYVTYVTSLEENNEIEQCRRLQSVAVESFVKNGGVVSHHHGIGKSFIQWARKQWDDASISMMRGIKDQLDPRNILNPQNFPFSD